MEKGTHTQSKTIVATPFKRWKDAKEQFRNHETNGYHRKASLDALNFVAVHEKKKLSIHIELDTAKQELIEKNIAFCY